MKKNIFLQRLSALAENIGSGPILVHSDIMHTMKAVKLTSDPELLLKMHIEALESSCDQELYFPAFNYDFTRTQVFDVMNSPSQVGALTEHARTHWGTWRTPVPIFSFCGTGVNPYETIPSEVDPFGATSIFSHLVHNNGAVLLYGTNIDRATIIHHVERMHNDGPLYRYDKIFNGTILHANRKEQHVSVKYHVRPMHMQLEYNWEKIAADLINNKILIKVQDGSSHASLFNAKKYFEYLTYCLEHNPFYLLEEKSIMWAKEYCEKNGTKVAIHDFE